MNETPPTTFVLKHNFSPKNTSFILQGILLPNMAFRGIGFLLKSLDELKNCVIWEPFLFVLCELIWYR
jgi:hypothetical protein